LGPRKTGHCSKGGWYSEVPPIKLVIFFVGWGLGWLFFTGRRCSEKVGYTGLTVIPFLSFLNNSFFNFF